MQCQHVCYLGCLPLQYAPYFTPNLGLPKNLLL
jgi:hypothetical protein